MNRLEKLLAERNHKHHSMNDLMARADKDNRPLSPEECGLFDTLKADFDAMEAQVTSLQEHEKRRVATAELQAKMEAPAGRQVQPDRPGTGLTAAVTRIPATARHTGKLKAFSGKKGREQAYRAGQWILGNVFRNERAQHWCLTNGVGTELRNAMGTNSNTDGGFLVPEELSEAIIIRREEYGVFRREVRVVPMGRDTLMIPRRLAGITIGPVGENPSSAMTQSSPTFNQVRLTAKKCGGLALMSTEVAEDAVIDIADWIAEEFAYSFATFEDQCGFIGDGTSTYLGIRGLTNLLTTANVATYVGAVAAASGHDTFAEVDATDLAKLMAALPQYAAMEAKFYCSRVAAELVFGRLMAAAGGNSVLTLQEGRGYSYLGYPIVISQVLPTSTSTINGTAMLFFGDLSKSSTMGDRREVRVFPSEHRYMDTDQIGIRGTERIDIVNHDLGDGTTAGPIVGLMGTT